jgi:two-component system, LytTR family, sensor kinase
MMLKLLKNRNIISHIVIWIIVIAYLQYSISSFPLSYFGKILYGSLLYIPYFITFYLLILYIIPKYWEKNKVKFFITIIVILGLFYIVPYYNWYYVYPLFTGEDFHWLYYLDPFFFKNFFLVYATIVLIAFSYHLRKQSINKLIQNRKKEQSLIVKELSFYKTQFDPHITFNFLNFIYSHANKQKANSANAIELYSDMLRYSSNQISDKMVELSEEIEYIANYIELRQCLNKPCYADFKIKGSADNISIYPRILLTFVENAFKHGDYTSASKPIEIMLKADNNGIVFIVKNRTDNGKNIPSTGVGLKNVKQSLENHYKNAYSLILENRESEYYCRLELNTN